MFDQYCLFFQVTIVNRSTIPEMKRMYEDEYESKTTYTIATTPPPTQTPDLDRITAAQWLLRWPPSELAFAKGKLFYKTFQF